MQLDWPMLLPPVIIAAVPLLVALFKVLVPLATHRWIYPIVAGVLGVLLDTVSGYATNVSQGPLGGLVLGMAGVALRELLDQVKKAVAAP